MSRLEQLKRLAGIEPNDPLAHYGLGLEYMNLERFSDAAACFAEAIRLDANCAAAYYHRGRAEILSGAPHEARATLRRGVDVSLVVGDEKTAREMRELLDTIE